MKGIRTLITSTIAAAFFFLTGIQESSQGFLQVVTRVNIAPEAGRTAMSTVS